MVAMLASCASTTVIQQTPTTAVGLPRPYQIWLYEFIASSSDLPTDSSLAGELGTLSTPPTAQEIDTGRRFGALIAQSLAADIQAMGLPAIDAGPGASPWRLHSERPLPRFTADRQHLLSITEAPASDGSRSISVCSGCSWH